MKQPSSRSAKQEVNKAEAYIGQLYEKLRIKLNEDKNQNGRSR